MRRITDREGRAWDVVVGRESFGALFALFVPAAGNPVEPRQTLLDADSQMDAEMEIAGMSTAALGELLGRSELKRME
jgi:hypothetical protein